MSPLRSSMWILMTCWLSAPPVMANELCAQCDDPQAPYCLRLTSQDGYGGSFSGLYRLLSKTDTKSIPHTTMLSLFGLGADPCERGDTNFINGNWSNIGKICVLRANMQILSGVTVAVSLVIPSTLSVSTQTSSGTFTFKSQNPRPALYFRDKDLQGDWGGLITEVIADAQKIRFAMPRSCIEVPYQ